MDIVSTYQHVVMAVAGCLLAATVAAWLCAIAFPDVWRALRRFASLRWWEAMVVVVAAAGLVQFGGSKSILSRSASDAGIVLVDVDLTYTNGVAVLTATATGGEPAPAWFRDDIHSEWTNAVDDAWVKQETVIAPEPGLTYTSTWQRDDTNGCQHAFWHFGSNPAPVVIDLSDGLTISGWEATGNYIKVRFHVSAEVPASATSTVTARALRGNRDVLDPVTVPVTPDSDSELTLKGFVVDKDTRITLTLDVLQ